MPVSFKLLFNKEKKQNKTKIPKQTNKKTTAKYTHTLKKKKKKGKQSNTSQKLNSDVSQTKERIIRFLSKIYRVSQTPN